MIGRFYDHVLTCRVSMHVRRHGWPWLSEFCRFVLTRFTPCRSTIFTDLSLIKPEEPFNLNPLLRAVLYRVSRVREFVNGAAELRFARITVMVDWALKTNVLPVQIWNGLRM